MTTEYRSTTYVPTAQLHTIKGADGESGFVFGFVGTKKTLVVDPEAGSLRANTRTAMPNQRCSVNTYYENGQIGSFGPDLVVDLDDITTEDDGISCFVDGKLQRWKREFLGKVKVKNCGLKADGVTDESTAILAMRDAGITHFHFEDGDYYLERNTDTLEALTFTEIDNLTFTFDKGARLIADPLVSVEALVIEGHNDDTYTYTYSTLASDASLGDNEIEIASGTYSVGQWIKIQSEAINDGPSIVKKGELVKIKAVSGTTLTLDSSLMDSYATADTAQISYRPFISNVTIDGFGAKDVWRAITISFAENVKIKNVDITDQPMTTGWGIALRDCVGVEAEGLTFNNMIYYGIVSTESTRDVLIDGIWGNDLRHVFTTLNASTHGQTRNITVRNGWANNCTLSSWDTHAAGENILFENLNSYKDGDHGIQVRCWKFKAVNCFVSGGKNSGYGTHYRINTHNKFINCIAADGVVGFALEDLDAYLLGCESRGNSSSGYVLAAGQILSCEAYDNGAAVSIFNSGDLGPIFINSLIAPQSAAQTRLIKGGDGLSYDLKRITIINSKIQGYATDRFFVSGSGTAPTHYGNEIFDDSTERSGVVSMSSGEGNVSLSKLPIDFTGNTYNRAVIPSIKLTRIGTYYPVLEFDDTDVDTSGNRILNTPFQAFYVFGDGFVYDDNGGTIGGLTDGLTYYITRNSFPTIDQFRLTLTYDPTTVTTGFTSALNGASVEIEVGDSSAWSVTQAAVFDDGGTARGYTVTAINDGTHLTIATGSVADESISYLAGATIYHGGISLTSASGSGFKLTPATLTNESPMSVAGMADDVGFVVKSSNASETGTTVRWEVDY